MPYRPLGGYLSDTARNADNYATLTYGPALCPMATPSTPLNAPPTPEADAPKPKRPVVGQPFQKGNPGRPVGSVNKVNQSIREAFKLAFERRGGADALLAWSMQEPTEFYRLVTKLIPQEITGPDGSQLLGVVVLPPLGGQVPPAPTPAERLASMERAQLMDGTGLNEP